MRNLLAALFAVAIGAAVLVACDGTGVATQGAKAFVGAYCSYPPTTRTAFREAVATAIAPNRIEVMCAPNVAPR